MGLTGEPGELGFQGDKVNWWDSRTFMNNSVGRFDVLFVLCVFK